MTIESAFFIEPKIVFGEIQPLLENKFSLFQIHRKKPYPLLCWKAWKAMESWKAIELFLGIHFS
jgi:hypothetical protein